MLEQILSTQQSQSQRQSQDQNRKFTSWTKQALKAFKRIEIDGVYYYTCNVGRLKECGRSGDTKEVTLWRTHFFLHSIHFEGVKGVIFSGAPGQELAEFASQAVEYLFVAINPRKMVNPATGDCHDLKEDLIFASSESAGK